MISKLECGKEQVAKDGPGAVSDPRATRVCDLAAGNDGVYLSAPWTCLRKPARMHREREVWWETCVLPQFNEEEERFNSTGIY